VIELLQCQQWLARKNFYAHCLELQDASDRDALLEDKNQLDFTPFWKPVVEDPRERSPSRPPEVKLDTPPRTPTRTDVRDLDDFWAAKALDKDEFGHVIDADGWAAASGSKHESFSEYTFADNPAFTKPLN